MKKITKSTVLVVLMALFCLAPTTLKAETITASNNYITKEVKVGNFKAIDLKGSPDIVYTQNTSGNTEVKVYGPDNIVDLLDIEVIGDVLHVKFKPNTSMRNVKKLTVMVTNPGIEKASITGSGDITLKNGIRGNSFEAYIKGSGDITGKGMECTSLSATIQGSGDIRFSDVKASEVSAQITGSGDISLQGSTNKAVYRISGSGDIVATSLKAKEVDASIKGSGDIKCYAEDYLKGDVRGSGEIGYKGNPKVDFAPKKGLRKL